MIIYLKSRLKSIYFKISHKKFYVKKILKRPLNRAFRIRCIMLILAKLNYQLSLLHLALSLTDPHKALISSKY